MATDNLVFREEYGFDDRITTLRGALRTMLNEVTTETEPVTIDPDRGIDFYQRVEKFEVELIETALRMTGGRQNRAAKLLHLPTSTLCTKMKQFNIGRHGSFSQAAR